MSLNEPAWIVGEFVETVQLQVVCETLLKKLPPGETVITEEHLKAYGNVDAALGFFYEESLREAVDETKNVAHNDINGVTEGALRNWFEKKLITPAGTRGLAYRGATHTEGLINDAVDVLDRAHIIREERRGAGRWYELSHDRFINPILDSNKAWQLNFSSALATRDWLEKKAGAWNSTHRDTDLLAETELPEAERWLESPEAKELGFESSLENFVLASRTYWRNEQEQKDAALNNALKEAKAARQFKYLSYALLGLLGLAIASVVVSISLWRSAARSEAKARAEDDVLRSTRDELAQKNKYLAMHDSDALDWATRTEGYRKDAEDLNSRLEKERQHALDLAQKAETAKKRADGETQKAIKAKREVELSHTLADEEREAFRQSRRDDEKEEAIKKFLDLRQQYLAADKKVDAQTTRHNLEGLLSTQLNLGEEYLAFGNETLAYTQFDNAIATANKLQLFRGSAAAGPVAARTLMYIGDIYRPEHTIDSTTRFGSPFDLNSRHLDVAIAAYEYSLELFEGTADTDGRLAVMNRLAAVKYESLRQPKAQTDPARTAKELDEIQKSLETAVGLAKQTDNPKQLANALYELAILNRDRFGSTRPYQADFEQARAAYKAAGDRRGEIKTDQELLNLYRRGGSPEERAKIPALIDQIAQIYDQYGDFNNEAATLMEKSYLATDTKERMGLYERVTDLYERAGNLNQALQTLMLWRGLYDAGQTAELIKLDDRSLQIATELKDGQRELQILNSLVYLSVRTNDQTRIQTYIRQIETHLTQPEKGYAWVYLGEAYLWTNQKDIAKSNFEKAINHFHSNNDVNGEGWALQTIGRAYRGARDSDAALYHYVRAAALYHEKGFDDGYILSEIGSLYAEEAAASNDVSRVDLSGQYYEKALATFAKSGNAYFQGLTLDSLGALYAKRDNGRALKYYDQAAQVYEQKQFWREASNSLMQMSKIYADLGDQTKALESKEKADKLLQNTAPKAAN